MGLRTLRAAIVALFIAAPAFAQTGAKLVLPPIPLLPSTAGVWQANSPIVDAPQDANAAILKEDALSRSAQRTYTHGGATMTVTAWQFDDATGAAAAFAALRTPTMQVQQGAAKIGKESAVAGNTTLLRESVTVVQAVTSANAAADLRKLSYTLPKISGPRGLEPALPTYLPSDHLIPGSVHYALGPAGYAAEGGTLPADAIGFDKSAEVATARYRTRAGGEGLVTLLLYPTPQIAGDRGRAVTAALNSAGLTASNGKVRREGPLVAIATGFSPDEAKLLVESAHLHNQVTWSATPPVEFKIEVRKTASLLTSIATFCGVMGLAAVLLGVFLGGGRAMVRKMMGKPAYTEPEFLKLGLREGKSAPAIFNPPNDRVAP